MNLKRTFFMLASFCGVVICYYTLVRNASFNITGRPSFGNVNGVVALTGFLSVSQHQLNTKTSHTEDRQIIRVNLSSLNPRRDGEGGMKQLHASTRSNVEDSLEELETYTVPKPTENKLKRKFKLTDDELEEKFLRNDERSIERIVNGLATDSSEELPEIFRKIGKPKKRLPNVIIIGVKKAGTRALLEIMKLHPQICASGPEIHYFDRFYRKGLEWYRDKMPICYENEITIEKTPSYFVTKGVANEVFEYSKRLNRTLRLIVIVRDPIKRAISDYTQAQANEHNRRTFEGLALRLSIYGKEEVNTQWPAIKIGVYSKHLRRWRRYFSPEQIHVVSGEGLIKQPYRELQKVEEFLKLPAFLKPEHFVYDNTKGFYCFDRRLNQLDPSRDNETSPLKCLGSGKGRTHVQVSNEAQELLREFYRPFNQELYDLIGRNFGWQ